jgi:hypothetical protein
MKSDIRSLPIALLLSFLLSGCASFKTASGIYTEKARQFSPPPGRAALYVIRPNQFIAAGSYIGVFIDHDKLGRLPPQSFLYAEITPREHILELAEVSNSKNTSVRFKAEEGKCYFYRAEVKAGFGGTLALESFSEGEGKDLVRNYEQSGYNEFDYGNKVPTVPK